MKTFNNQDEPKPCDFKRHYEDLLNAPGETKLLDCFYCDNAPIQAETDSPIEYTEVEQAVNSMKDKSSGPDGLPSGLLKFVKVQWIFFILNLLNFIFQCGKFPIEWIYSTLSPKRLWKLHRHLYNKRNTKDIR